MVFPVTGLAFLVLLLWHVRFFGTVNKQNKANKLYGEWTEFGRHNYGLITQIIVSILYTFGRVKVIKSPHLASFSFTRGYLMGIYR